MPPLRSLRPAEAPACSSIAATWSRPLTLAYMSAVEPSWSLWSRLARWPSMMCTISSLPRLPKAAVMRSVRPCASAASTEPGFWDRKLFTTSLFPSSAAWRTRSGSVAAAGCGPGRSCRTAACCRVRGFLSGSSHEVSLVMGW